MLCFLRDREAAPVSQKRVRAGPEQPGNRPPAIGAAASTRCDVDSPGKGRRLLFDKNILGQDERPAQMPRQCFHYRRHGQEIIG
jgi:hypothetical protein